MTRSTGRRAAREEWAADCVADSAGGITFDVMGAARPDAVLVLRRRPTAGAGAAPDPADPADPADDVRLPLTGAGGRRLRAVLPSTVELPEGHWDVRTGARGERPVRPGVRDARALVGRTPGAGRVIARVPYVTADGTLAVRSWVRAPHAEVGEVRCARGTVTVEGTLYGAELGPDAAVEARRRGGGETYRAPVTGKGGGGFAFTLPYARLAAGADPADPADPAAPAAPAGPAAATRWWDLWLLPAPGVPASRVARILDDVGDRRGSAVRLPHPVDGRRAAPYYTEDNGLSVRLEPAPAPAATPARAPEPVPEPAPAPAPVVVSSPSAVSVVSAASVVSRRSGAPCGP